MIRYKLYQNNNAESKQYKKWYARAVCEETIDTAKLAKHMAEHNSPYSQGVIHGGADTRGADAAVLGVFGGWGMTG